jgi:hypothetical protein
MVRSRSTESYTKLRLEDRTRAASEKEKVSTFQPVSHLLSHGMGLRPANQGLNRVRADFRAARGSPQGN